MKEQALQEIRRRSETATDMKERIRWKVIGMMVETDLSFDRYRPHKTVQGQRREDAG